MFASTREDLTEEEASDQHRQLLHHGAAVPHPKTSREPEAPEETTRLPRSHQEGTKMTAIDGPNRDIEPRILGEPPSTRLYQPEEVTANRYSEGPDLNPDVEQVPPDAGAFKRGSSQVQEQPVSFRVKKRGGAPSPKGR